jgi:hypothetical protein
VIFFFENGRLGNQLFQYYGLRQYFREHSLVFFGCEDLRKLFNSVDVCLFPKTGLGSKIFFRLLKHIFFCLVSIRVLGRITEDTESPVFKVISRRGLFWNIYLAQNVFFQHSDVASHIKITPKLKHDLEETALNWLSKMRIDLESKSLVFEHVRRGDYFEFPSRELPAALNFNWYKQAIRRIQEKIENPVFVVMGDDQLYLRNNFEESKKIVISDNVPEVDLAIMSFCHSGILSASTFAWWGAFYARYKQKQKSIFLGPKYWCGHQKKKWYPTNFLIDWITYIE